MKRISLLLLTLVFLSIAIYAQTNSKKPIKECNALLARQQVEQQALESKTVEETDKRVNILLRVADFLWISDEETARKYFAEAFQTAQERFKEKGIEAKTIKGITSFQPDYRFSVIEAVAKRDAEWAKKLTEIVLKEFDEDKEKEKRDSFHKDREFQELLGIAARVAKDNPNLALTLARRAMRYPLNFSWYFNLYQMAGNNQSLADQIYSELLVNYANSEVYRLLYLSAYPFGQPRIFGIEKYSLGASVPDNFSPNQNLKRQFLLAFLRRVLKMTAESTEPSRQTSTPDTAVAWTALNELEPMVSQQFPDLIETVSQAKIHVNSIVASDERDTAQKRAESARNYSNKSFDEKLEDLRKVESDGKLDDFQIYQLISSAKTDEDYEKSEIWIDKMKDEIAREGTTNYYFFNRSKLASKEKRFDDARKYALKVAKIEHRAVLFFDMAEAKLREPLTKSESLDTLLEVYQTAIKAPDSVEKAQVLLGTAFMYEKINHLNALDSLAETIKTANKLENPNLFTSNVSQQINGKTFVSFMSYNVPGFDVSDAFYALSQKDFQNALTYATSFSDKYLRTLAVLATVKDCEKNDKTIKPRTKTKQ